MRQPLRMIDKFRRRAALGAERLPGWMCWIGIEAGEAALLDDRDRATSSDAEPAINMDALRIGVIGHRILFPIVKGVFYPAIVEQTATWNGKKMKTTALSLLARRGQ